MLKIIQSSACNQYTSKCSLLGLQRYSTTTINSTDADKWISSLDDERRAKITQLQAIVARMCKYMKDPTPINLDVRHYERLLAASTNGRRKYLMRLQTMEIGEAAEKKDQVVRKVYYDQRKSNLSTEGNEYALSKTALLPSFQKAWMMKWQHLRMAQSIYSDEPKVVFDCSFNHTMCMYDQIAAARQIRASIKSNRESATPFVMHFCNLLKNSPFWQMMEAEMSYLDQVPIKVHEQDITQVIPPEKLVYLSPNSEHVLEEFNPNDCYVIGCIVDRKEKVPLTLNKATKLNIRTARLPIDRHVTFRLQKALNLEHVMRILITAKSSKDWQKEIIRHIPRHKYENPKDELELE